jgi:hypothetical protein
MFCERIGRDGRNKNEAVIKNMSKGAENLLNILSSSELECIKSKIISDFYSNKI